MVDVLQLQGSTDDLLLEDGSGKLALESMRQTWIVQSITNSTSMTLTTTDDIPVGSTIILGTSRSTATGSVGGVTSITDPSGNTWNLNDAESIRASTYDIAIHRCVVTTLIPAGSTITIAQTNTSTRKTVVGAVFADLVGTLDQTSGNNSGGDGGTSAGANGSSTTPSASTLGATTVANEVIIGVMSYGGASEEPIVEPGFTKIGAIRTNTGSADRGIMMEYKVVSATGVQSASSTNDASGGWAAAIATYPIASSAPTPTVNKGAFFALL